MNQAITWGQPVAPLTLQNNYGVNAANNDDDQFNFSSQIGAGTAAPDSPASAGYDFSSLTGLSTTPGGGDSDSGSLGLNTGTLGAVGNVMGGIGSLAKAWAALKTVGVAKDQLAENQRQYNQNYASQRTTINNRLNDQNAWKTAQGRTDMASLVV